MYEEHLFMLYFLKNGTIVTQVQQYIFMQNGFLLQIRVYAEMMLSYKSKATFLLQILAWPEEHGLGMVVCMITTCYNIRTDSSRERENWQIHFA